MKAFITGATGFVGSHVARALAAQGADLRLLVRATSRLDNIADLRAETATGDLREPESLKKAMAGCEFVFHVAADYRFGCATRTRCIAPTWKARGRSSARRRKVAYAA